MDRRVKLLLFGFVSWLVPFVASFAIFPLYNSNPALFHSLMLVFGSAVSAALFIRYFEAIKSDFAKVGLFAGTVWCVMNWVLDIIILVPMMQASLGGYFAQIGMVYLVGPIMGFGMGYVVDASKKRK
jgi:hypothetical protein